MKFSFAVIVFAGLFFSCSQKEKKPPVLSENKMREVMWDLLRADQFVSGYVLKDSSKKKKEESVKLYAEIFQIHHITEQEFKTSLDYYSSRPELFRPIVDSLALRKSSPMNNLPKIPAHPHNKDSLVKAMQEKHLPK